MQPGRSSRPGARVPAARVLSSLLVAVAVFFVAFDDGGYGIAARGSIGIAAWWGVILAVGLRVRPGERLPWASVAVGGLLAGLAVWSLASIQWSSSSEAALAEFNRVSLLLGIFVLVLLVTRQGSAGGFADGLAVGTASVAVLALLSRLFYDVFPDRGLAELLPSAATRLSYPVGYWNGLGVLVGLGVPLLVRSNMVSRSVLARAAALGVIPICAATVYLTSSRGGVGVAVIGAFAFVALTTDRWAAAAALVLALAGSAAVIIVFHSRGALVNGPLDSDVAADQGRTAALLIMVCCLGTSALYLAGARALGGRPRPGRAAGLGTTGLLVVVVAVGLVAAKPVRRLETFKALPSAISQSDFVSAHLMSGNGSGRWQFWASAVEQWRANRLLGGGAGSYEQWWAQSGSFSYFLKDAHSLYLEQLGELGPLGLLLVASIIGLGIVTGASRAFRSVGNDRVTDAALTAVLVGFAVAASIDWVWELTVVSGLAMVALALVSGPGTSVAARARTPVEADPPRALFQTSGSLGIGYSRQRTRTRRPRCARPGPVVGAATVLVAALALLAQSPPLLGDLAIADSQSAAMVGDLGAALSRALDSRRLQPWAASPYTQLALVDEQRGDLRRARAWIDMAIRRDEENWRLWLIAARLETKLGLPASAQRRLQRAAALNPRSPLFAGVSR